MNKKSIVWGACWFNETVETVIEFLNKTILATKNIGLDVIPVIFSANHEQDKKNIDLIYSNISDVIVLQNEYNIYPNKNYGLSTIVEIANRVNSDFVTVVDPDWSIDKFSEFIEKVIKPLINNEADLVIPNICSASGRSNLLVGLPAVELFYPDYKNTVISAFPGSFAGVTNKIYLITNDKNYNYDWGGEWDLISYAVKYNFRIISKEVSVVNVRHRNNSSKILDSFQIWKAILSNEDIVKRYDHLINSGFEIEAFDDLSRILIDGKYQVLELIDLVKKYAANDTERQLLYMVLYPIASILHGDIDIEINESSDVPYDKNEIHKVSSLAVYCVREALLNSGKTGKEIVELASKATGKYFGNWKLEERKFAKEKINLVIEELL